MGSDTRLTDREIDVMGVLWQRGSGTVAEVRARLGRSVGYTGVLKLLQILEEKGAVRHEREGRAYRYFPLVGQAEAGTSALDRVVDRIFGGSAERAGAHLVSERSLTPEAIERLKETLDAAAGGGTSSQPRSAEGDPEPRGDE